MSDFGLDIARPGPRYFKASGSGTSDSPHVIATQLTDDNGNALSFINSGQLPVTIYSEGGDDVDVHDGLLHTASAGHAIGELLIPGHKAWKKTGYNPEIANVEETVWSNGGSYVWPTAEQGLEVVSTDNTQDIGTQIKTGTSDGGTTTTLIDSGADFTAATAVAVGDCVILDKSGTRPEWGKVTGVTATTLTIAGGFSYGGTGDARDYIILDYSAHTGASAIYVNYLDSDFVLHGEIIILNGTTVVPTVNTDFYRINGLKVVCAGSLAYTLGDISLRNLADTPVYGHITAGYTIGRQAVFTVPIGVTLYINSINVAWASPNDSKVQSARIIIRANIDESNSFNSGPIFYPYMEIQVTNQAVTVQNEVPVRIPAKTDVIVSCVSSNAAGVGPSTVVMRGWVKS